MPTRLNASDDVNDIEFHHGFAGFGAVTYRDHAPFGAAGRTYSVSRTLVWLVANRLVFFGGKSYGCALPLSQQYR